MSFCLVYNMPILECMFVPDLIVYAPTTEISISKYQLCWGFFNAAILLACIFKVFFDLILCMCGTIWKLFVCILILQRPSQDYHKICNLKRAIKCFPWKFVDAPPHCWLLVCTLPQLSSTRLFSIGFFCAPALEVFFSRSIPSASRRSGFELSCTPSWEVCLVPFSTFVQHFSFFYGLPFFWAWVFVFYGP